jgi:hypothetical protein
MRRCKPVLRGYRLVMEVTSWHWCPVTQRLSGVFAWSTLTTHAQLGVIWSRYWRGNDNEWAFTTAC